MLTPKQLSGLLAIHREGEVMVTHTTGPWIAKLTDTDMIRIVSSTGPVKCLVAKLNKRGEAAVKAALIATDDLT